MQLERFTPAQALTVLRAQIQDRLEDLQEDTKQAVDQGHFERAQTLLHQAQALKDLLTDLDAWAKRFTVLVGPVGEGETDDNEVATARLHKGLKTPESAYRVPILRALVALGGEGRIQDVLDRVYAEMEDRLNPYDLGMLSDGKTVRWRNTAQWARNTLREEGLIRDDTPHGVWGISDQGRRWLARQGARSDAAGWGQGPQSRA